MKLFSNLTDFSIWKAKSFLQSTFAIMFTQSVLIALIVVLYSYSFQMALLENTILNAVLSIESANPFQKCSYVFTDT